MARSQINIRVEDDLIAAIKQRCDEQDISQTEFIINAIKAALGIPMSSGEVSADLEERLAAQIDKNRQEATAMISCLTQELAELRGKLTA